MSEAQHPSATCAGSGPDEGPPRLTPRALHRPPVDPTSASLFGRPPDVPSSFADRTLPPDRGLAHRPPPTEALADAFGRPTPTSDPLRRPAGPGAATFGRLSALWASEREPDPWRNPAARAELGAPAITEVPGAAAAAGPEGARLSVREVLFGGRIRPTALLALAVVALLVGTAGGLVGRLTGAGGALLTAPDVTLAQNQPAKERPAGSVADVAARVLPAVVSLEVRTGDQGGTGSGVVIDSAGYVVTNNHVVALAATGKDARIEAVFHDGTRVPAQVVGRDPRTDLAVVKIAVANPTVAVLGRSADLAVGDGVIAVGSPLGLAGTVTDGIVSAVHRPVRLDGEGTDTNAVIDAIQTDAAINPGNSGGALADVTGSVVGINTAIRTLGSGASGSIGLGFAIPIDDVRTIAQELIRTGVVRHADLGVNAKSVSDGTSDGAQVQNVQQSSAAADAGVAEGDVVTKVGDRTIASADELVVAVREHRVGETVALQVVREGRPLVLAVTLKSD